VLETRRHPCDSPHCRCSASIAALIAAQRPVRAPLHPQAQMPAASPTNSVLLLFALMVGASILWRGSLPPRAAQDSLFWGRQRTPFGKPLARGVGGVLRSIFVLWPDFELDLRFDVVIWIIALSIRRVCIFAGFQAT